MKTIRIDVIPADTQSRDMGDNIVEILRQG